MYSETFNFHHIKNDRFLSSNCSLDAGPHLMLWSTACLAYMSCEYYWLPNAADVSQYESDL